MVNQMVMGFDYCTTELILSLDDVVYFEPTFIEEIILTLLTTNAKFVSPIVRDISTPFHHNTNSHIKREILKIDYLAFYIKNRLEIDF